MATVTPYKSRDERDCVSVSSEDGKRVYCVTPETGPGKLSPVRGWKVWKSDSLNTIQRFPATEAGRNLAIKRATELADA